MGSFVSTEGINSKTYISLFGKGNGHILGIYSEFSFRIVSVHLENSGERSLPVRNIKKGGHIDPGTALIDEFGNGVSIFFDGSIFLHIQRESPVIAYAGLFPDDGTEFFLEFFQSGKSFDLIKMMDLG